MSLRILVDMNLSPDWIPVLQSAGWQATHWSREGNPNATDAELMAWAATHGYVVFTHDLDFAAILALTHQNGPSVIQVRGANVLPDHLGPLVITALRQHESDLASGALLVVEESKLRVRVLPI